MGNRPSSVFGFGVAIQESLSDLDDESESPYASYSSGEPIDGVVVVGSGWYDEPTLLVLIHESVSHSPDWSPRRIDDWQATASAKWRGQIESFMEKWKLTPISGFEVPGFIHAPRYG